LNLIPAIAGSKTGGEEIPDARKKKRTGLFGPGTSQRPSLLKSKGNLKQYRSSLNFFLTIAR
jgi:hypothetical protein